METHYVPVRLLFFTISVCNENFGCDIYLGFVHYHQRGEFAFRVIIWFCSKWILKHYSHYVLIFAVMLYLISVQYHTCLIFIQILFQYPPGKRLSMSAKDLAAFCFPNSVKVCNFLKLLRCYYTKFLILENRSTTHTFLFGFRWLIS